MEQVSLPEEPEVVLRTLQESLTEDGSIPTTEVREVNRKNMKLINFEKSTENVVKIVSGITGPIPDHTASHWLPTVLRIRIRDPVPF